MLVHNNNREQSTQQEQQTMVEPEDQNDYQSKQRSNSADEVPQGVAASPIGGNNACEREIVHLQQAPSIPSVQSRSRYDSTLSGEELLQQLSNAIAQQRSPALTQYEGIMGSIPLGLVRQTGQQELPKAPNIFQENTALSSFSSWRPTTSASPLLDLLRQEQDQQRDAASPAIQQSNHPAHVSSTTGSSAGQESESDAGADSQKPKPSRLPCRARGMPEDHDYSTAYFQITSDTKHGDALVCSFVRCRNEGIKFIYCAFCRDAVGRRIFRNQHHHLDDQEAMTKKSPGGVISSNQGPIAMDLADKSISLGGSLPEEAPTLGIHTEHEEHEENFIPCRARGMPVEHDFKRAYFVVSNNAEHGKRLVCSFPACRNVGIRFRYCKFCNDAVARRNFKEHQALHHTNGDEIFDANKSSGGREDNRYTDTKFSGESDRMVADLPHHGGRSLGPQGQDHTMSGTEAKKAKISEDTTSSEDDKPSVRWQLAWDALLEKRPSKNDAGAMNKWLKEVVTVSDSAYTDSNAGSSSDRSDLHSFIDQSSS